MKEEIIVIKGMSSFRAYLPIIIMVAVSFLFALLYYPLHSEVGQINASVQTTTADFLIIVPISLIIGIFGLTTALKHRKTNGKTFYGVFLLIFSVLYGVLNFKLIAFLGTILY